MDNSQLILTFIEETEENLEILEEALLQLEKKPADRELLDTVFRAVHSIKGGAGLVGLNKINDLVHNLENILEDIRSEGRKVPGEVFDFLFEGMDVIREIIDQGDFDSPVTAGAKNLKEALDGYHYNRTDQEREVVKTEKRSPSLYELKLNFRPDIFSTGTDPLLLLLELTDSGVILSSTLCTEELPLLDQLDPTQLKISWELLYYTEEPEEKMENIFIFVKDDNDIRINKVASDVLSKRIEDKEFTANLLAFQDITTESEINKLRQDSVELEEFLTAHFDCLPEEQDTSGEDEDYSPGRRRQRKSRTVRVKGEKLEDILNEIAELLISQSRVKELTTKSMQSMERSERMEIVSSFEEVDKIIRRVQNKVMNASMIPISGTFTRMERLVRDLAKKYDKEIELEINGRETELDRKIIEQLADPLKHLIRNSVDHGIEPPRKRVDKGKPEAGKITLEAYHREGNIVIKVSDDGAGIDKNKVMEKAEEKNLISGDEDFSDSEVYKLLFEPGFSTANEVTDVSGRGVGLDVVKSNIQNLRGRIEISSQKNKGTTFTIKLPLTLAIIDGILVQTGEELFVLPLSSIVEFVDARKVKFKKAEGRGTIINLRDDYLPYISLYRLLEMQTKKVEARNKGEGILVILSSGEKKLAVQVDEIIGQEQVVIKSVKENIGRTEGITGATIMGDGNVALILDVSSLFRLAAEKV